MNANANEYELVFLFCYVFFCFLFIYLFLFFSGGFNYVIDPQCAARSRCGSVMVCALGSGSSSRGSSPVTLFFFSWARHFTLIVPHYSSLHPHA